MVARSGMAATSPTRVALPTAFIDDPVAAYKLAIGTYFTVGSLSVFVWDSFYNLEHDFQLVRVRGWSVPSAIYFVSRVSTWAFAMLETILLTSTMLLSYFRVCAIWNRNTTLKHLFGILWLFGVCGGLTSAAGIVSKHYGGSPYCTESVAGEFVSAAVIGPMVNHLAVFLAITYGVCKICAENHDRLTIRAGYRVFVLGESLPTFSKAVLQSCQLCYLAATVAGIIAVVWFYVFASSSSYRLAMFVPYAVTVNIMFSWVFRRAKLGMCAAAMGPEPSTRGGVAAAAAPRQSDIIEMHPDFSATDPDMDADSYAKNNHGDGGLGLKRSVTPSSHVEIEVNRVVEYKHDYPNLEEGRKGNPIDLTFQSFVI
ncbi:hypothetical protein CVT25_006870 [Psilocybe cyanescens]|uniref:DUF6533 domain-containing protein n=1 Tax=Psilocybe cyanescens TaxID=93625 RepID=A0A409XU05_PSICY|nr:hypothetical protein CVT25_006870 [Psilocybe cyanescens]